MLGASATGAAYVAERHDEAEPISELLHDLYEDMASFDDENPPASAHERRRTEVSLCLEMLIRPGYETRMSRS